jgi:two-component system, NarL family, response regulator DesR
MVEQQGKVRIVIADDVTAVRRGLRDLLEIAGNIEIVGEAVDGLEALEQSTRLRPDAIVLDIDMPEMDGYVAAGRIRAALPGCRIVALTVLAGDADRRRAADAGFDAFVIKGAPLLELLGAISSPTEPETVHQGGLS